MLDVAFRSGTEFRPSLVSQLTMKNDTNESDTAKFGLKHQTGLGEG